MSQSNQNHSHLSAISVGLIIVAILALALTWYNMMNPHVVMVTQQQLVTNTQNMYNTQTVTSFGTLTTITTISTTTISTTTAAASGYGYGYYPNCGYYGCYPSPSYTFNGNYYTTCQSTGSYGLVVQCSGYEIRNSNGCILIAIPVYNGYTFESQVYQYYTLRNLPSTYPPMGSWVTVTGQMYQGYNTAPNGGSCPGNYINVTSISQ